MNYLYPDCYLESIYHIDFEKLRKAGRTCLVFDIDNTIAAFDEPEPTEQATALLTGLRDSGFNIALVSNNSKERVERFNKSLGFFAVSRAAKPMRSGLRKALSAMSGTKHNAVLIGDQIFTDVLCGKRAGLYVILVKPRTVRDEFTVKLKRGIEKLVINSYLRRERNG